MKKIKRNYVIIFILVLMAFVCFSASYAFLTNVNEQHGKLNIKVGDLKYKIESDKLDSGNITVPANTTQELTIKLTSLNEIDSKYELYYQIDSANDSVNVGYRPDTENPVLGSISANDSKNITIVIANKSSSSTKISFGVVGGLIKNDLVLSIGNSLNKEVIGGKVFANAILADNNLITAAPTLTNSSNNTSDASGLYKSTDTDSGNPTYYFRGNVTNNYVKFADSTWRIIRINEDGTVRMILEEAIDTYYYGTWSDYDENATLSGSLGSESNIDVSESYYNNYFTESDLSKIVVGNFCEKIAVKPYSSYENVNKASLTLYNSYTPSFKCSPDGNNVSNFQSKVGLISYDEIIYAGGYFDKSNSSYYLNNISTFSLSLSGVASGPYDSTKNLSSTIWYLEDGKLSSITFDQQEADAQIVINLNNNVTVTGDGTESNPYVVN